MRRLLLRLDGLRLELAVLLLEESGLSAQGGDLDLVRGLHLGAQRGLRRAPGLLDRPGRRRGLVDDGAARRRGADGRRGNPTRGRDASLWLVRHETRLRLAEGDGVPVRELLAVHLAVVEERSVGGPQVHQEEGAVLAPDLRVLGRNARVGDLDVAARAAPDGLRVGAQLDLLAFQRAVQDAQRGHEAFLREARCWLGSGK